ncbi:DUF2516 family protein [Streptomyces sp. CA-210063]|uniref:DUF2516 family protein n=1 Tax=Streptomyces sp. CA-210063 TaxID=2801029 RepID=UPI00214C9D4A|nr:DUF2516 family protein [Streptomyces sp. CA-210063]UUU37127.1 DUF2516 family protein [Streptomyces sp. CA-210063]
MLMTGFAGFLGLLKIVLMALAAFGLFDAAFRREDAFRAADKQTKVFWLIILGIALVVSYLFHLLSFLPIIGAIASIVYIVDVRPAVKQVSGGGGGRRGGSSSDGPYGPYNGGR